MTEFYTVVYTIHDAKSFEKERQRIMESFKSSEGEPWAITAVSTDHEIMRCEFMYEAADTHRDPELVTEVWASPDVGNKDSLADFQNG